jgi:hypothetical protein
MKSIKKGQRFLCLKDYIMDDDSIAYKCGQIYEAVGNNILPSIIDSTHWMDRSDNFDEHFEKLKKKKSVTLGGNGLYIQNIPVVFETVSPDSIVDSVIKKFKDRSDVGIKKYGTTLDRKDINFDGWAEHLQQELMDGILYLERLRKDFKL